MLQYLPIIVLSLVYLYYRIKNHRQIRLSSAFSGPRTLPFIGGIWRLLNLSPDKLNSELCKMSREYGGIYRMWGGLDQLVFYVSDAQYAKLILSSSSKYLAKTDSYAFLSCLIRRNSMFLSGTARWRSLRKLETHAFHFGILEHFEEVFDRNSRVLVDRLKVVAEGNGQVVDIHKYVTLMALDNI